VFFHGAKYSKIYNYFIGYSVIRCFGSANHVNVSKVGESELQFNVIDWFGSCNRLVWKFFPMLCR
jgi:hypothetical protein